MPPASSVECWGHSTPDHYKLPQGARNYRDMCVIPEIAVCYDGSGQPFLRASALSAPLREIILAQRFDRAWPRDCDNRRVPLPHASHGPPPRAGEELFRRQLP